jgi:UDP-glucose-4-epimerase GalE
VSPLDASSQRTVLVTGGAGYIGSHCCKALAAQGWLPVVYDNLSTGHREFVKWGPLVEADIRDRGTLEEAFRKFAPTVVMHLAANALVGESTANPGKYWDVNVGGTLALLEAMRHAGADKIVFSSTCAVYGEPARVPIDESEEKHPLNPYGASKLAAERMLDDFDQAYGLKSLRFRYFNAAGADPQGEIGEDHTPETHLIPLVLDAALGRRKSVTIYGDHYPTPDGTPIRDYIHVADLAAAHVKGIKYLMSSGATAAVNLGTGKGASVAEVIAAAEAATGRHIPTTIAPPHDGDPSRLIANPAAAERLLDWRASSSDLATVVADAWAWHGKRFESVRRATQQRSPLRGGGTRKAVGSLS